MDGGRPGPLVGATGRWSSPVSRGRRGRLSKTCCFSFLLFVLQDPWPWAQGHPAESFRQAVLLEFPDGVDFVTKALERGQVTIFSD